MLDSAHIDNDYARTVCAYSIEFIRALHRSPFRGLVYALMGVQGRLCIRGMINNLRKMGVTLDD